MEATLFIFNLVRRNVNSPAASETFINDHQQLFSSSEKIFRGRSNFPTEIELPRNSDGYSGRGKRRSTILNTRDPHS